MTFKDLARLIRQRYGPAPESADPEIAEAQTLLDQLHTNYIRAYQQRKDNWFKEHPEEKYLNESYEEFVKTCTVDEWYWYFIERVTSRTPEQRYQDEKNPDYGWNHKSEVHSIDDKECRPGCRFWPDGGRIENIEILEDYEEFQDYQKVREIWESIHNDTTVHNKKSHKVNEF